MKFETRVALFLFILLILVGLYILQHMPQIVDLVLRTP